MFDAKTIRLAESLRPDLDFSVMGTEQFAILKIVENASGGGVEPIRNAVIENGIATFNGVVASSPLVSLLLNIPITQTGSGTPSPTNIRDFVGVQGVNIGHDSVYDKFITWNQLWEPAINIVLTDLTITSPSTGVYRFNGTIETARSGNITAISLLADNVYFISSNRETTDIVLSNTASWIVNETDYLVKPSTSNRFANVYVKAGTYTDANFTPQVINLTQLFGATKADEIYTMEQAQAGAGVAYFKSLFPNGYYAYNAGELSTVSAVNGVPDSFITITFGQTVYSAILDVLNGKLYLIDELKTIDENSDITMSSTGTGIFILDDFFEINEDTESVNSDVYQRAENRSSVTGVINNNPDYSFCCKLGTNPTRIMIKDTRFTSTEDYNTWLANNPVKIAVKLAEPIEIQLTPTVINTLIGENVIFADVANVTECKYTRK